MRKIFLVLGVFAVTSVFAQNGKLVDTWNAIGLKEFDKAKAAIDVAAVNEDTKNSPKMWYYRGWTYYEITNPKNEKFKNLHPDAPEKAMIALLNCLQTDKKEEYKKECLSMLIPSSLRANRKAEEALYNKDYDKAAFLSNIARYNLPKDYPVQQSNILKAMTQEEFNQVIKKAFNTGKMIVVIVGDKEIVKAQLEKINLLTKDFNEKLSVKKPKELESE